MKKYEVMFIVKPTLAEEDVNKVVEKYKKVLTDNKASITGENDMGQRELAYEIKKFKSGHYFVLNFETENENAVNEFNRLATIDADIVRHLITKVGE
jgi:small subunit ribosomal protein S6